MSHEQAFAIHAGVHIRDELAIAVPHLGRMALAGRQIPFGRLAPPRMGDFGVHIGPEAVLVGLDFFPATTPLFTTYYQALLIRSPTVQCFLTNQSLDFGNQ